jgi:hypothetical protein
MRRGRKGGWKKEEVKGSRGRSSASEGAGRAGGARSYCTGAFLRCGAGQSRRACRLWSWEAGRLPPPVTTTLRHGRHGPLLLCQVTCRDRALLRQSQPQPAAAPGGPAKSIPRFAVGCMSSMYRYLAIPRPTAAAS